MTIQAKMMDAKPMDVKKTKQLQPKTSKESKEVPVALTKRIALFGSDVKAELQKINWTNYEELKNYTKIVVISTFVFGLGIYLMDLLIQVSLRGLEYLIRLISG